MNSPLLTRLLATCAILHFASITWADGAPKPIEREAVLAKLKENKVSLNGLTIAAKDGGPAINLGVGEYGAVENNATDENLRLIAQLPELERVTIYGGKYTKEGLSALAALPKLRGLQLYKPDVPADAFAVLPKLHQLNDLSIGEYPVTDEILGYAGQIKGLKSFNHTKSAITPAGFLKFLDGVESLEQLTLFGDFVDDACLKRIGQMKGMKRFWTNSKKVTSPGWVHLAGLTQMQDLNLSKTNFGDESTPVLEGMKGLKSLILNESQISDAGMPSLAGLTKLHDLGLEGTQVTDKGMASLKNMAELENLYVGMTDVTAKGLAVVPKKERIVMMRTGKGALTANQLDEMMQMFPKTQIFDPSGFWTNERIKAAMKELGKVPQPLPGTELPQRQDGDRKKAGDEKKVFRSISFIYLDDLTPERVRVVTTQPRDEAVQAFIDEAGNDRPGADLPRPDMFRRSSQFADMLRQRFGPRLTLAEIDLSKPDRLEFGLSVNGNIAKELTRLPEVHEFIARNETVTSIESGSYRQDGYIDDATLASLVEVFPSVRSLRLNRCPVTSASLPAVGKWSKLELLSIQRANLSGQPLTPLGNLTELRTLELMDANTNGSLEFLTKLRKLDRLFCNTDDANTKWIGGLSTLRTLDLCGSGIRDAGLKQLSGLTNLEWLGLQNSNITDEGLAHVSRMSKLHFLNLDGTRLTGSKLSALKELPLSQLQMANTELTGENWMRHVPELRSYEGGLMMITRNSKITADEADRIRKMLKAGSQAFLHDR